MYKDIMNPLSGEAPSEPLSLGSDSNLRQFSLKTGDLLSPRYGASSVSDAETEDIRITKLKEDKKRKTNRSETKVFFVKFKDWFKEHSRAYISAILVIALAISSFFAISFYIELKSAEKTIATYETEFSDALKMYKELKRASDQKMKRRYELIHDRFPDITRTKFETIKYVFSKQGNKDYTVKQLKTLGYTDSISRRIYTLWYEA
ncbi:MAG: hypothetical protein IJF32_05905 [Oscillospiraceae bacterium]|nr:hypothetical protein [Oscillospiraceae bacterium]